MYSSPVEILVASGKRFFDIGINLGSAIRYSEIAPLVQALWGVAVATFKEVIVASPYRVSSAL